VGRSLLDNDREGMEMCAECQEALASGRVRIDGLEDLPPETREMIESMMIARIHEDMAKDLSADRAEEILAGFLESLDAQHLLLLARMLRTDKTVRYRFVGMIHGVLRYKHGLQSDGKKPPMSDDENAEADKLLREATK
jgi:hypothetical protein